MKRKYLITLSLFTLIFFTSFSNWTVKKHDSVVVLELFTSQGCSSCPSADALLEKVGDEFKTKNVFTLSYHVDYWDYIGWKDPFSQKQFTDKQRAYARKFRDNQIYTPAVIVNGKEHFVGSNRAKMYAKIKAYKKELSTVGISLCAIENTAKKIKFNYTINGSISNTKARVVLAIQERTTKVKRGENARRTLKNSHIVVAEKYLTNVEASGNYTIDIPKIVTKNDKLSVYMILENTQKDILTAQKLDFL
ncbi:hypothetical protein KAOT1_02807 [Kordia algicida OT-1]|uniref:DUF1223 domain-containing protein n=2 Tax=Kordia TaxID=221065 RepID=A9DUL1_9FLAO|nr:DUF1223 domain-containing protein [Kordia algicida]EDP96304.1 hypothetical protein KAOT1_02807 [Kordia algicida OT-1]